MKTKSQRRSAVTQKHKANRIAARQRKAQRRKQWNENRKFRQIEEYNQRKLKGEGFRRKPGEGQQPAVGVDKTPDPVLPAAEACVATYDSPEDAILNSQGG